MKLLYNPSQQIPVCTLTTHFPKRTSLFLQELSWGTKFKDFPKAEDQNAVVVHDSLETVSDRDDQCAGKLLSNRLLNLGTCSGRVLRKYSTGSTNLVVESRVNLGSGFVHDDYIRAPQNGSGQRQQLTLSSAQ